MVLPQPLLPASYLHRTPTHHCRPLGAPYPAPGPAPGGARRRVGGESWGTPRPRVGPAGQPAHAPAPPPQAARARRPHASGARRRRLGAAQRPHLWHAPGGPGAPPPRGAPALAHWLRAHPGVDVITRDRSSAYADGARQGAPTATQVADRFHLIQNLAEALTEVFTTQRPALDAVNAAMRQQPVSLPDGTVAVPVPPPATPPRAQQQAAQRAAQRQATYEQVWTLHRQGWTVPAIAAQVGHSRHTIERYLRLPAWPVPQHRSTYGRSVLNPYKVFLLERWNAGCRTAMQLFRELQPRGYTGSYRRVAAYASRLRQAQGLPPRRQGRRQQLPVVAEPASPPLTPRRATWLVLGRKAKRTEAEAQQLTQLHAQDPQVAEAIDLAQDFTQMVRQRQPAQLDPWLQRATASTLEALQRFATGLHDDYAAVKAGVTLPWSNGPVEGHINRLKMLKRQMFGRAHLDLLSRRFVGAPRDGPAQTHAEAASPRGPPEAG